MHPKLEKKTSKFLSLVLRHKPETIGLTLDDNGWASVNELLKKLQEHGRGVTLVELQTVVANNNKQRFSFNEDGSKIRANQGHSIEVNLNLTPTTPPAQLYHGTATRNLGSILHQGLLKGERHHVHLSDNHATATAVGQRYGKPIVLHINTQQMYANGHLFFCSDNGVWLTEHVPPQYIEVPPH